MTRESSQGSGHLRSSSKHPCSQTPSSPLVGWGSGCAAVARDLGRRPASGDLAPLLVPRWHRRRRRRVRYQRTPPVVKRFAVSGRRGVPNSDGVFSALGSELATEIWLKACSWTNRWALLASQIKRAKFRVHKRLLPMLGLPLSLKGFPFSCPHRSLNLSCLPLVGFGSLMKASN